VDISGLLALLFCVEDFAALHGFFESGRRGANFTVDDCVFLCLDARYCATHGMFLKIVHYACDFGNLPTVRHPCSVALEPHVPQA
jgi:hypothetical protein